MIVPWDFPWLRSRGQVFSLRSEPGDMNMGFCCHHSSVRTASLAGNVPKANGAERCS